VEGDLAHRNFGVAPLAGLRGFAAGRGRERKSGGGREREKRDRKEERGGRKV